MKEVNAICGRFTHYTMDGLASDLIVGIWAKETEFDGVNNLRRYVWGAIRRHEAKQSVRLRFHKLFSECLGEDESETEWLDRVGAYQPTQMTTIDAKRLRRFARGWPMIHQKIFLILAEGGSILEAAQELGLPPWDAIRLLRECRTFVETGNSLQSMKEAA